MRPRALGCSAPAERVVAQREGQGQDASTGGSTVSSARRHPAMRPRARPKGSADVHVERTDADDAAAFGGQPVGGRDRSCAAPRRPSRSRAPARAGDGVVQGDAPGSGRGPWLARAARPGWRCRRGHAAGGSCGRDSRPAAGRRTSDEADGHEAEAGGAGDEQLDQRRAPGRPRGRRPTRRRRPARPVEPGRVTGSAGGSRRAVGDRDGAQHVVERVGRA